MALAYDGVLVTAVVVLAGVGAFAWRRRDEPGGRFVVAYAAASVVWSGAELAVALVGPFPLKAALFSVLIAGVIATFPAWFLFTLVYTGRWNLVTRRGVALVSLVPAATLALLATNPYHGLVFASLYPIDSGAGIDVVFGPAFYLWAAYTIGQLLASLVLLLDALPRAPGYYRRQILALVVGTVAPAAGSLARYAGLSTADLTPVGLAIGGLAIAAAISRTGFLDVTPVAGDVVMDTIDAAVFVVDRRGRLVQANAAASEVLGGESIGQPLEAQLPDEPEIRELHRALARGERDSAELAIGEEHYRITASPLTDRRGTLLGRVFLVTTVTEQHRRERELERQNARLDEFAAVVSHDLRNPLTVLDGHLDLARETGEAAHFEAAAAATERMQTIIDDVLALARDGRTVAADAREPVSLDTVASSAWRSIPETTATLDVVGDARVEADPDRLRRVLENLFRNAIEHGAGDGTAIAVRVGPLDDGFFVEDDGRGIPPVEREAVLESGYSTAADGTGFGLAIVGEIADAHGWTVSVGESAAGGARFEVTGAARAD